MPDNPGLGAGLANAGTAFTSVFYCTVGQLIMNPSGLEPTLIVQEGHRTTKYFSPAIALNFPYYNFAAVLICLAVAFILIPTMRLPEPILKNPGKITENEKPRMPKQSDTQLVAQILRSRSFISLWAFYLFLGAMQPFFTTNLKSFGLEYFDNTTLQLFSIMQTVCTFIGKVCGGMAIDKFGLKKFNTGLLLALVIALMAFVYGRDKII